MTVTYRQTNGRIEVNGTLLGVGYSGHGVGLNNTAEEAVAGIGPIPAGRWKITSWEDHHGKLGPIVAILEPVDHDAHGRSLFRIHGDNAAANHTASDGCIVANRIIRELWRASGDTDLEVVP